MAPIPRSSDVFTSAQAQELLESLRCESIGPVADAFVANLSRVVLLGELAPLSATFAREHAIARIRQRLKLAVPAALKRWTRTPIYPQAREATRAFRDEIANPQSKRDWPSAIRQGRRYIRALIKAHPEVKDAITSVLSAQLIGAWTAFEAMAADLWVTAVNECPSPLAVNWGASMGEKAQGKSVPLSILAKYGHNFDLHDVMGTLLKNERKVDFQSLKSTRSEYVRAFGQHAGESFDQPQLQLLELLRNVIAHRAGVVDAQFLNDIKGRFPAYSALRPGDPLPLDSDSTDGFIKVAAASGVSLIRFVDSCLYRESRTC